MCEELRCEKEMPEGEVELRWEEKEVEMGEGEGVEMGEATHAKGDLEKNVRLEKE